MAEEASRERNYDKMQRVVDEIIDSALDGNKECRKLVWQAVMSKGSSDDRAQAQEKVEININAPVMPTVTVEGTFEEVTDG